jgi:hypothetical protein
VIAGFEAAWVFFGGVFAVVVPDNMKTIVDQADATAPRLNDAFREYAQARGFAVDPARREEGCRLDMAAPCRASPCSGGPSRCTPPVVLAGGVVCPGMTHDPT